MSARAVTADLLARLQRHYIKPGEPFPGGVFLPEVGWNGPAGTSRADALYVGFTGTSGRILVGHELKASRSDWLRELDKAGKADAWADQCHAWYVVAAPDVVKTEELPHGWGLMLPGRSKTRMEIKVKAEVHADRCPSWEALRSVLARADTLRAQAISTVRDTAAREAREKVEEEVARRVDHALAAAAEGRAQRQLAELHEALGAKVDEYAWDSSGITLDELRTGAARYLLADRDLQRAARDLASRYEGSLSTTRERIDKLQAAVDQLRVLALADQTRSAS